MALAHDRDEPLTYDTPDAQNMTGSALSQYIGRLFRHSGNNKVYVVVGLAWDSPRDLWSLVYREASVDAALVTRDHITFFGQREGKSRFYHYG